MDLLIGICELERRVKDFEEAGFLSSPINPGEPTLKDSMWYTDPKTPSGLKSPTYAAGP